MGLYDRDYTKEERPRRVSATSRKWVCRSQRSLPGVKFLLIANIGIYLTTVLFTPLQELINGWLQLDAASLQKVLQLWRLITYQFLHAGFWHICFNMLGLYFLGPTLERHWGTQRFLPFYFGCGIAVLLFYLFLVLVRFLPPGQMIGASGAILGLLAACAILFPQFVVFLFIFPVPIRIAALVLIIYYLVTLVSKGVNAGGEAAHLAGMAAGALYAWSQPFRSQLKLKLRAANWQKQMAEHHRLQAEVDRILQKVHDSGLHSLTSKEKRTLKKATKAEQSRRSMY